MDVEDLLINDWITGGASSSGKTTVIAASGNLAVTLVPNGHRQVQRPSGSALVLQLLVMT